MGVGNKRVKDYPDHVRKVRSILKPFIEKLLEDNPLTSQQIIEEVKKKFSKNVSNNRIDKLYDLAIKSGAIGGKLAGAGGGGHLVLYCEKSKQPKIVEKMNQFKIKEVKFSFYNDGAKILNMYDYAGAK